LSIVDEGSLAYLLCLDAFCFPFGGDVGADLGEDGRDVGRRIVEGGVGACMSTDSNEVGCWGSSKDPVGTASKSGLIEWVVYVCSVFRVPSAWASTGDQWRCLSLLLK
jgi:hypothetical protein